MILVSNNVCQTLYSSVSKLRSWQVNSMLRLNWLCLPSKPLFARGAHRLPTSLTFNSTSAGLYVSQVAQVCMAMCFCEWHNHTTPVDKLSAISWFTAFLDGSSTFIDDLVSRKKKPCVLGGEEINLNKMKSLTRKM